MNVSLEQRMASALAGGGRVVFLTGAGVSAESGVPTFRGADGYWTVGSRVYRPQELATRAAFQTMPDEVWRWYLFRRTACRGAEPNPAHRALVDAERELGDRFLLVTQNVDGLHLRAGSSLGRTYQIHGNIDFMRCAGAHEGELVPIPPEVPAVQQEDPFPEEARALLVCPRCTGRTRPHVLWFDEYYDEALYRFESSLVAAAGASVLVTAGTAGATNLPNQMVAAALRAGALLVDINPDESPFARAAEDAGGLWLRGPASVELPRVARAVAAAIRAG
ncbi:MAG TPA: Sir2 family NAD-dependent protein deacetylase [Kofleriaceae bacterium]|nr:Sir2 family NAD-dependent protein deacetylase [Kofleriaceae bacterium]